MKPFRVVLIWVLSISVSVSSWAESINPSANTGQQSQNSGSGANNAAGAALIAAGAAMMSQPPTVPMGIALMAMGMLALAQGKHDKNAAGQSAATARASDYRNNAGTNDPTYTDPDKGVAGVLDTKDGKAVAEAIKEAGGSVNKKGITMPDGSFKSWSSFSSAGSLAKAGFDSAELMKKVGEIEAGLPSGGVSSVAVRDGEGGGGAASAANPGAPEGSQVHMPASVQPMNRSALIAGKTIDAGGEPIGAKGDDLFAMVHRVYTRKREGNHFILDESLAAFNPANSSRIKNRK